MLKEIKSLTINKALKKGDVISFSDLDTKKPKGFGILASEYEKVIGKKLKRNMSQWDFLNDDDSDKSIREWFAKSFKEVNEIINSSHLSWNKK